MIVKKDMNIGPCPHVSSILNKIKELGPSYAIYQEPIHNDKVLRDLIRKGYKIESLDYFKDNNNFKAITPAHGITLDEERIFKKGKYEDLTCPIIRKTYKELENHKELKYGIIGDFNHREVKVILDRFKNVIYISNIEMASLLNLDCIIFQSTYSPLEAKKLLEHKELHLVNTLCPFVKKRFDSLGKISEDMIIVITDKKSANGKRIYEAAKLLNPKKEVYQISELKDLKKFDLDGVDSCYLTSATSVPNELVNQIEEYLKMR